MAEVVAEIPETIEDGERTATEENMEVESEEAVSESNVSEDQNANGVDRNGDAKRSREDEEGEADGENGVAAKKQKVERSVEEERLEKLQESEEKEGVQEGGGGEEGEGKGKGEKSDTLSLGPKSFCSSVEMFDYFFKFLHSWPPNVDINKYEQMVLLDLLKKGHLESDKKIGSGVRAFQVRYHPMWKSRCFFILRQDDSVDDFSFRKCVDRILPLPEEMKVKSGANKVLGGRGGRGGGGGRGRGGRGGSGRRGGHGRGRGGR